MVISYRSQIESKNEKEFKLRRDSMKMAFIKPNRETRDEKIHISRKPNFLANESILEISIILEPNRL